MAYLPLSNAPLSLCFASATTSQMQASRLLSHSPNSPSFESFSTTTVDLAAVAARVVEELRNQELQSDSWPHLSDQNHDDDDFEFSFDSSHSHPDPIATADEIFCNGQIRPLYPYALFNSGGGNSAVDVTAEARLPSSPPPLRHHRPALRNLMSEERDSASCSSLEADEDLIGIPPETYCVWTPKRPTAGDDGEDHVRGLSSSPSRRKIKSNSTGSSKRWKLRELLYARSSSDGNEKFVFQAAMKKAAKPSGSGEENPPAKERSPANGGYFTRNKSGKAVAEDPKRRSYLPYRKDLVGILANANGLSRNLRPF